MDKRTLLAIALSIAVMLLYQTFFAKPPAPPPQAPAPAGQEAAAPATTAPAAPTTTVPGTVATPPAAPAARALAPESPAVKKDIVVDTPLYHAVFSTAGGGPRSFQLKHYRKTIGRDAPPVELVQVQEGMPYPLGISFPDSTVNVPAGGLFETNATAIRLEPGSESQKIAFTQTYPGEIKIEKVFTFHADRYVFDLEVRLYNLSPHPLQQNASLAWTQFADPAAEGDSYGHDGPITSVAKSVDRENLKDLGADKVLGPNVSWAAYESKYFISALVPQNPSLTSLSLGKDSRHMVSVSLRGPKNVIPPGQAGLFSYALFLGPKDHAVLKTLGVGLENAIDFGDWLKWLAMPLLMALKFIYKFIPNYGIAIILLTLLIKILFWPLGNKSYKSMKEMQKLQPKVMELREKYKDDKSRLSQETMALYKTHKVNPLGGCLPMVVQIPVFFGLYKALLYAIELRHSPLAWWIQDLSAKDPYYITPIIMGGTMFIQQKMTPTAGDPMQAKIMLLMPVIFTVMFLNFPSGLVIYWLFNNILSIGQQYYINKRKT